MSVLGQACLLVAFVGSGFAAFACLAGAARQHRQVRQAGIWAAGISVLALTIAVAVLAGALIRKDFSFAYVAQYSDRLLPWQYSLSALWVGQAGSLLLWAWLLGVLALLFRWWPRPAAGRPVCASQASTSPASATRADVAAWTLREPALGVLLAYLCFLCAVLVFAADPLEASLHPVRDGSGLSPLLQHPAMLLHPPVVFLGYALWTVPFALAAAAVVTGRLEGEWIRQARAWALAAWSVLGIGILLGADWAYEELGWGGYWGWDPVENGSLIPWLTGTALIHALLAWERGQVLKKTTVGLAFGTFALCNFATFLTRSGVFSSLHAFSRSPIGWLFLVLMTGVVATGTAAVIWRRKRLSAERPLRAVLSREALVTLAVVALLLLAAATLAGTVSTALSALMFGTAIMVGPAFYNGILIPVGLALLLITALTPLTRWGRAPRAAQRKWWVASSGAAGAGLVAALLAGVRQPMGLAIAGLAALAVAAFAASLLLDTPHRDPARTVRGLWLALRAGGRQRAGLVIHLGLIALAVGVAGSALGKREQSFSMTEGQTVAWAGRSIRLKRVIQRELPDKLVAEAVLEISRGSRRKTLVPAQHYHKLRQEWTTEVAIDSTWRGDLYTILHSGTADGRLLLTLVENPLMRWLWIGGAVMVLGSCVRLFPGPAAGGAAGRELAVKRRSEPAIPRRVVPRFVRGSNLKSQI